VCNFMIRQNGKDYSTISDAAKELGVTPKSVRDYIKKGIIPAPPEIEYGIRTMLHFPPDYMRKAKVALDKHRKELVQKRKQPRE
jgi:hypothetical protein